MHGLCASACVKSNWKGRQVCCSWVASVWARTRPVRRLRTSPTTRARTPPPDLRSATMWPTRNAARAGSGTSAWARRLATTWRSRPSSSSSRRIRRHSSPQRGLLPLPDGRLQAMPRQGAGVSISACTQAFAQLDLQCPFGRTHGCLPRLA